MFFCGLWLFVFVCFCWFVLFNGCFEPDQLREYNVFFFYRVVICVLFFLFFLYCLFFVVVFLMLVERDFVMFFICVLLV